MAIPEKLIFPHPERKYLFSNHILSITKKAYSKSFLLSRCFLSKNPSLLKSAFSAYVRPLLEYASPIWSPHLVKDIKRLEKVQRLFSKTILSCRHLPYATRLQCLSLPSLSLRRTHIDLCTCYRIVHCLSSLESGLFFTRRHTANRGHPFSLVKPPVRLDSTKFSFQSRVIDIWNSLPMAVVSAVSLVSFKSKLKYITITD